MVLEVNKDHEFFLLIYKYSSSHRPVIIYTCSIVNFAFFDINSLFFEPNNFFLFKLRSLLILAVELAKNLDDLSFNLELAFFGHNRSESGVLEVSSYA